MSGSWIEEKAGLTAYSSDGSIYSVQPDRICLVKSAEDICRAVNLAYEKNLSITPRGGGTGLNGGAIGNGIILDFSHMQEILDIDIEKRTILTQSGIIYDNLNHALKPYNLFFPPDPSSGDSCQIGGMIANNSSGPRSVKYGLTSQFVDELNIIGASGEEEALKILKINNSESSEYFAKYPRYKKVFDILSDNAGLIKERWPRLKKNSAGYNLLQVVEDIERGLFNLPALMVGSEGTLGLTVSARLRLLPIPGEKLTVRLYFRSLVKAGEAVASIGELGPSGLEIVDGATLDLIGRKNFAIPDSAAALLLVEFDEDIENKKQLFNSLAKRLELNAPPDYADNPEKTALLWKARKAIVPTLYRHHPTKRPIALVEDVSLPPDKIPAFIEYVTGLFKKHELTFGIFGHIGDGNLHVRPLFDMNDAADFKLAGDLYHEIYDKVISFGGSTTAEHADGRLRAEMLKKLYSEKIFSIFKEIKNILDPRNILSPDSVLSEVLFTEKIDFEKLKSYCAACGKCNGYCPANEIFRREDYSPRGWLRMLNQSGESFSDLKHYLDYCLNCKNCTIVCPAGVDIAGDIIRFRSLKQSTISKTVVKLTDNDTVLNLSLKMGKTAEPIVKSSIGKNMLAFLGSRFGLEKNSRLPEISEQSLRRRFPDRLANNGRVAFFHGCADNLFKSDSGDAVFQLFDILNIKLVMPDQKCCGLPHEVYGFRENLIKKAKYNIERLNKFEAVITGCASCLLRLKEYHHLFDKDSIYYEPARQFSGKCYDISHYLNKQEIDFSEFSDGSKIRVTYHHPCHLRAAGYQDEPLKLMRKLDGVELIEADYADRCCGQAGSYGYTHYQEAKRIFARKKEAFQKTEADFIITSCPACRMKIDSEMNGAMRAVHPVEILTKLYNKR